MTMRPAVVSARSHGDLHNLEFIEDRSSGVRRQSGLPTRYSKGRFLGKGGFAKCYEVCDMETKDVYAAKIVAKASIAKPRAQAKLRSEISIHRSLDHNKVVKFYNYFEDSEHVYIILELCSNQTLNEFMRKRPCKRLSEPEAMFYLYELIVALKYLHRRRVIHRDLKLGNLFLDANMHLKVGDFGLAAQLEHDGERKRTICGTPNYIAPEILEGKHGHSYEVDTWSLGVILYTMLVGRPPFETSDVKTTYRRIRYNQYSFPENVHLSDHSKQLVSCILRTDPRSRPSLDDILAASWFQQSRMPPPMPVTVGVMCAASPRNVTGRSSARSDTPERGMADFARIDSPAPRFPLRDRSPGSFAGSGMQMPRPQTATPSVVPSKTTVQAQGTLTPTRSISSTCTSARPPLAQCGNDENLVPNAADDRSPVLPSARVHTRPQSSTPHLISRKQPLPPPVQTMSSTPNLGSSRQGQSSGLASFAATSARDEMTAPPAALPSEDAVGLPDVLPELWVTKWVDYSSKYGVGYILSDGSIGVYFNDSTKIILVADGSHFDYITRRTLERPETHTTHTFEDYPDDLKKKVTLLRHFKNHMLTDSQERRDGATMGESSLPSRPPQTSSTCEPGKAPFVKKWTRNRHAIMFQLSNKIVQVVFQDKTEAVLSSRSHIVTYCDKKGEVSSYPLSNVLDVPSPELAKRLRYTKDILVNLLGTRGAEVAAAPPQ
mmetsp:Transcript_21693/g.39810  ORF Transcript_21693/g.39810 Transcript_21693/m.39810 type:complete len:718 (+) Transcript_21693:63-2216(+)